MFWVGKSKNTIERWSLNRSTDEEDLRWEKTDMIRMGAAFRGEIHQAEKGGLDVFKGENVVACRLEGDPVNQDIDVNKMDDASLWRFGDILPERGFAFHQTAPALTCAPFSPKKCIILNTASLFVPKVDWLEEIKANKPVKIGQPRHLLARRPVRYPARR